VRRLDAALSSADDYAMSDWPHAPLHRLTEQGAYMVTCGTYGKLNHLFDPMRLDLVQDVLFECAVEYEWQMQAWAILSNHYHFIASSPADAATLGRMLSKVHTLTARKLNTWDATPGRKVWFQYFDSHITYASSYYPRLKYVHQNPAHHGVVLRAENYRWCSAGWFARNARPAYQRMVEQFKIDTVRVRDEFEPAPMSQPEERAASSRRTPEVSPASGQA
jgi:putative transposase